MKAPASPKTIVRGLLERMEQRGMTEIRQQSELILAQWLRIT